jgi:hypothetical protein
MATSHGKPNYRQLHQVALVFSGEYLWNLSTKSCLGCNFRALQGHDVSKLTGC